MIWHFVTKNTRLGSLLSSLSSHCQNHLKMVLKNSCESRYIISDDIHAINYDLHPLLQCFMLSHTTRIIGFTLGATSSDILYIFGIGMTSRFQNCAQWNPIYCRFWKKLILWFIAITLENMFSVIARDPDGRLKKFLCLNNFSFNSRISFTFKKYR